MRAPAVSVALALFSIGAAVTVGCDGLPEIDRDTCGNAIVERLEGEECDAFVDAALANDPLLKAGCDQLLAGSAELTACKLGCADPDEASSCQYVWGADPDDTTVFRLCPVGFGYGSDGVCRRSSGQFDAAPFISLPVGGFDGATADLDGDGNADLVVDTSFSGPNYTYFQEGGTTLGPFGLGVAPAVGQISDDAIYEVEIADLVLPLGSSLVTLRGEPGPSFNPKAYVPFPLGGPIPVPGFDGAGNRVVLAVQGVNGFEQPYLAADITAGVGFLEVSLVNFAEKPATFVLPGLTLEELREPETLLSVDLLAAPGGEIAYATATAVHVGNPTLAVAPPPPPPPEEPPPPLLTPSSVSMKPGAEIQRLLPVDNWPVPAVAAIVSVADGAEIALVEADDPALGTLKVSYFALQRPGVDPPTSPLDVLAVGDIDGDGDLDAVTAFSVAFLGYGAPMAGVAPITSVTLAAVNVDALWLRARIADLNGSGRMSVVALSTFTDVQVMLPGTDFVMTPVTLATGVPTDLLQIADYDGDGLNDVLVATEPDRTMFDGGAASDPCYFGEASARFPANDDLLLAYGRSSGAPEPFELVGSVPGIRRLASGRLRNDQALDAIADVGLQTWCDPATLDSVGRAGILLGASDRSVFSPYLPFNGACEGKNDIVRVAIGDVVTNEGEPASHNDLVLLSLRNPELSQVVRYEVTPLVGAADAELGTLPAEPPPGCPSSVQTVVRSVAIGEQGLTSLDSFFSHAPALIAADLLPDTVLLEAVAVTTHSSAETATVSLVSIDGLLEEVPIETGVSAFASAAKARAVDVDGDGDLDVLVFFVFSSDVGLVTKSWVLFNDPGAATHLSAPVELSFVLDGAVGVGGDAPATSVDAIRDAVALSLPPLCPDQSALEAEDRVDCDPARRLLLASSYDVRLCAAIGGDGKPTLSPTCQSSLFRNDLGFDSLLGTIVADFDGDGLEDIALLGEQTLTVHRQCSFPDIFTGRCDQFGAVGALGDGTRPEATQPGK